MPRVAARGRVVLEDKPMSTNASHGNESIDVEPRTERALSEPLSVVSLDGTPVESTDETIVMVVSHSGESYHVDAEVGRCECPDHKHRDAECKHIRRARIELGETTVDSRVLAAVDVNEQLGANAPGPRVATSDGGIIEAGDDGEILDEQDPDDDRPDDCDCGDWNAGLDLPCWPCYRDGFEEPNPDADDE
jgi:hypothetical protein